MNTNKLLDFAQKNNILLGVTNASRLYYLDEFKQYNTPFVSKDFEKRIDPKLLFKQAKSIIVIGVPYGKKLSFKPDNHLRGTISISAVGVDYHIIVKQMLKKLADHINQFESFNYKMFVDSPFLIEKELAKKAGIGYHGKNSLLISDKFGSYFFIGYLICDLLLDETKSISFDYNKCKDCDICIKACPTGALNCSFRLDFSKCISYLTQQTDPICDDLKSKMGASLYGCDICQTVCPLNKGKQTVEEIFDIDIIKPKLLELDLTDELFKQRYGNTALYWRGKAIFDRNVKNAIYNLKNV